MRVLVAICLILGLPSVAATAGAEQRQWLTSVDEALSQAQEHDQRILVDLYADWCGWCKRLEEEVFSTPTFLSFVEDFVLLRVDTEDGGEGSRLQRRYGAYSLPTTLVIDPSKAMIAEVKGFAPAPQYIASIQQELAAFDELVQGYDRFGQSDELAVLGILADEFHQRTDGDRAAALYRRMLATGQLEPNKSARIQYQLTDALRLASRFDEATNELNQGRESAVQIDDPALVERFDLQSAQISLDRGDCDKAERALEDFLGTYPKSTLVKTARHTLKTLKSEGYQCT